MKDDILYDPQNNKKYLNDIESDEELTESSEDESKEGKLMYMTE